jgi:hypothetical protein
MGISKNSAYSSLPIAIGMEKGDGLRPLKTGFLEMPLFILMRSSSAPEQFGAKLKFSTV